MRRVAEPDLPDTSWRFVAELPDGELVGELRAHERSPHLEYGDEPGDEREAVLDEVLVAAEYRRLRSIMIAAEQQSLLALRDDGDIGDDIMRRVQRDLDMESLLLDTPEPVVEPASEVNSSIEAEQKD